jgi:hypothetical protein
MTLDSGKILHISAHAQLAYEAAKMSRRAYSTVYFVSGGVKKGVLCNGDSRIYLKSINLQKDRELTN